MTTPRLDIDDFVAETREALTTFEAAVAALRSPELMPDSVASALRAMHTIKGNARLFGLAVIEQLAHAVESVLERSHGRTVSASTLDGMLAAGDLLASLLDDVRRSDEMDTTAMLAQLDGLPGTDDAGEGTPPALTTLALIQGEEYVLEASWPNPAGVTPWHAISRLTQTGAVSLLGGAVEAPPGDLHEPLVDGPLTLRTGVRLSDSPDTLAALLVELGATLEPAGGRAVPSTSPALRTAALAVDLLERAGAGQTPLGFIVKLAEQARIISGHLDPPAAPLSERLEAPALTLHLNVETSHSEAELAAALKIAFPSPPLAVPRVPSSEVTVPSDADRPTSVRVNTSLLDRLLDLTAELVIVRNQALASVDADDARLRPLVLRMHAVTRDLQAAVMRTRMQPIGVLFRRYPRMVRDLGRQLGKEIELDLNGEDVELDRSVLEVLADPLVHLVRNAADHGIEAPGQRRAAGKPAAGKIELAARHEAGRIHVRIRDDGGGIDPAAVAKKARALGLRQPAQLDAMSPKDLIELILLPGFSTAAAITDVSGRGVGMDVVKTNLEQIGGRLAIDSTLGQGTQIELELPLTLAIVPCLLVTCGSRRFAIPQKDVDEVVYLHPELANGRVERSVDGEVFRLRGKLLPVVRLGAVFGQSPSAADAVSLSERSQAPVNLLITRAGPRRYGLIVDAVLGGEEIVQRPPQALLKPLACFSGTTILGDGDVVLVVDSTNVARRAGLPLGLDESSTAQPERRSSEQETPPFLLFEYGPAERFAVPLQDVRRLDRVEACRIERIGGQEFALLAGTSTLLVRLEEKLDVSRPEASVGEIFVVAPRRAGRPLGLVATRILDTAHLSLSLQAEGEHRPGVLGVAVVDGRQILVLELNQLLAGAPPAPTSAAARVLVVDDSEFFRRLIAAYLTTAGFQVDSAANGAEGLEKLAAGDYAFAISDIEMPVLDGYGFARAARAHPRFAGLPLLALTSLSSEADKRRALAAGFTRHEVKLDRDRLLAAVARLLEKKGCAS